MSRPRVPGRLEHEVSQLLDRVGSVMDPSGYVGNLRARHQEPASESALTKLAPQMGATLIVVLSSSRGRLEVTFRDGHTGSVIADETVPARGRRAKLGGGAKRKIAIAARHAMSKVGPAPEPSYPTAPAAQSQSTRVQRVAPTPQMTAAASDDEEADQEDEDEDDEQGETEDGEDEPASAASDSDEDPVSFAIHAAGGVGTRTILVPSRAGGQQIATGYGPALDVGLALQFAAGRHWMLRAGGDYRTIFGLTQSQFLPTGAVRENTLSSHSVMGGASLGYLSDGPNSLAVHMFLGWAYRSLTSPADSGLPSASVSGPVIRPELIIPFGHGMVSLRIAPELIIVVDPVATLPANVAGLEQVGIAYGGELSLDFRLSRVVALGLQFRESRASTASGWGYAATENERYIVGRLQLTL